MGLTERLYARHKFLSTCDLFEFSKSLNISSIFHAGVAIIPVVSIKTDKNCIKTSLQSMVSLSIERQANSTGIPIECSLSVIHLE